MLTTRIGMIGVGRIGLSIALNLLKAGFTVQAPRRAETSVFESSGGIILPDPMSVAQRSDVVLTCLPTEESHVTVLSGTRGLLAGLKPDQLVIELATFRREFKVAQAQRITFAGGRILEAELSGSPSMIAKREGALYLGGDEHVIAEYASLLEAISHSRFHIGTYGAAVSMKIVSNYLLVIHTLAAAEAINLGVTLGFDSTRLVEVLRHGSGASAMLSVRGPLMATRAFLPAPGSFKTLEKYLGLASEAIALTGCNTPLFDVAEPLYRRAIELGMENEDIAAIIKLIEDIPGRPVPTPVVSHDH